MSSQFGGVPFLDPLEEARQVYGKARIREIDFQRRFQRSGTWEDRISYEEAKWRADQLRQLWFALLSDEE
jgi:hypothetical protein